jgi:hypothetical protein
MNYFSRATYMPDVSLSLAMTSEEDVGIEELCQKCKRKISEHPSTGRFHTIILYGSECAWDPDNEVKDFVVVTLKNSGYDLENFGLQYFENHS